MRKSLQGSQKMRTFAAAKRGVAQLVAFLVWDQAVAGSSPVTSTTLLNLAANFKLVSGFFCVYTPEFYQMSPRD